MRDGSTNKRAAGYIRVSTDEQSKRFGLEVQRDEILSYARSNRLELFKIYDDAGFSGSEMDRPGLMSMLDDSGNGNFNTLILYKTDRLARDNFMAWWIEKELAKHI